MVNDNFSFRPLSGDGSKIDRRQPSPLQKKEFRKPISERREETKKEGEKVDGGEEKNPSLIDLSKKQRPTPKTPTQPKQPPKQPLGPKQPAQAASGDETAQTKGKPQVPSDEKGEIAAEEFPAPEESILSAEESLPERPLQQPMGEKKLSRAQLPQERTFVGAESPKPSYGGEKTGDMRPLAGKEEIRTVKTREGEKTEKIFAKRGETSSEASAMGAAAAIAPVTQFQSASADVDVGTPATPQETIAQLVTELVDKIQVVERSGSTETTITLSQPPLFAGAQVTLTTEGASREFNIAFSSLSEPARSLIVGSLDTLKSQLDQKGIVVHNVIATTEKIESIATTDTSSQTSRDRQQGGGQQPGGGGGGQQRGGGQGGGGQQQRPR